MEEEYLFPIYTRSNQEARRRRISRWPSNESINLFIRRLSIRGIERRVGVIKNRISRWINIPSAYVERRIDEHFQ